VYLEAADYGRRSSLSMNGPSLSARASRGPDRIRNVSRRKAGMLNDWRSLAAREDHPPSPQGALSVHSNITPGKICATRPSAARRAASSTGSSADRPHIWRYVQVPAQRGELAVKCAVLCASCLIPRPPADAAQFNTRMNARVAVRSPRTRRPQGLPV